MSTYTRVTNCQKTVRFFWPTLYMHVPRFIAVGIFCHGRDAAMHPSVAGTSYATVDCNICSTTMKARMFVVLGVSLKQLLQFVWFTYSRSALTHYMIWTTVHVTGWRLRHSQNENDLMNVQHQHTVTNKGHKLF